MTGANGDPTAGGRPGVVLVHGVGGDATAVWSGLSAQLKERYEVVAPDLSGTSARPEVAGPITVAAQAEEVLAAARGLETFDLVGYSLGSVVALRVAALAPDRVRSLALIAPWVTSDARQAFFFDAFARIFRVDPELAARMTTFSAFSSGFFEAAGVDGADGVVSAFASILSPGTDRQALAAASVDESVLVAQVSAPTLVVGLTHDLQVPVEHARELARRLARADYVEVDSGHALPWERPEALSALVRDHLRAQHG